MEQDTKECSVLDREKDLVSTRTQMVTSTKVNGKTISVRAKEPSSILEGAIYRGHFRESKRDGYGVYKDLNGFSYERQWKENF